MILLPRRACGRGVDLSQETIAKWIAASRSTVARAFAELRESGVIQTMYRTIIITDPARMLEIVCLCGCLECRRTGRAGHLTVR
jgi:hypothetical protein